MALTFPEILIEGVGGGLATPDYCQPPSLHQSTLIFEWFAAANKNVYTFPSVRPFIRRMVHPNYTQGVSLIM